VITSTDRGFSREAVADAGGHFTFSNLPAGVYSLKAQQQGFRGFEQKEVTVTINAVIRVDVTLEVGNVGETVTVNTEAPPLQTDTADQWKNAVTLSPAGFAKAGSPIAVTASADEVDVYCGTVTGIPGHFSVPPHTGGDVSWQPAGAAGLASPLGGITAS